MATVMLSKSLIDEFVLNIKGKNRYANVQDFTEYKDESEGNQLFL